MAKKLNGTVKQMKNNERKSLWLKAAGAVALFGAGLLLYRKKQRMIGGALISGSVKMLSSMAV